jgi:hypothetical protein
LRNRGPIVQPRAPVWVRNERLERISLFVAQLRHPVEHLSASYDRTVPARFGGGEKHASGGVAGLPVRTWPRDALHRSAGSDPSPAHHHFLSFRGRDLRNGHPMTEIEKFHAEFTGACPPSFDRIPVTNNWPQAGREPSCNRSPDTWFTQRRGTNQPLCGACSIARSN